ncbi:ComEA family DNA-binding protein [Geomonas paludis]|uniref:DNA-binding protein n=1 Tax=Geomonas paludis TaxID=2740185 RepID=A0A6V8MUG0_9BACT|nr:helix-hairpin-helix domain-containing protein [Geomonas paludis]GFO63651.1 hypothetical protein GMPD_15700 [Geomonas paludis]
MKKIVTLISAVFISLSVSLTGFAADKAPTAKPAKAAEAAKPAPAEKAAAAAPKDAVVDINTASEADLKALPGVGDAYSKKILAGRPYAKKDQLLSKKILPKATYDKVKDKIVAKQAK